MYKYNLQNLQYVDEIKKGYISLQQATRLIENDEGLSFIDNGKHSLLLGQTSNGSATIKVCSNVGISNKDNFHTAVARIEKLNNLTYKPDMIFDHTPSHNGLILWSEIRKIYNGIIGFCPVLSTANKNNIDKSELLELIDQVCEGGVNLIHIIPTINRDLYNTAKHDRFYPLTSWSGGLLYDDMIANNREQNVVAECFDEILKILKKHNATCDIGIAFRPIRISECLDAAHTTELKEQEYWINKAKQAGVLTIREIGGHIPVHKAKQLSQTIGTHTPSMPLPVSIDSCQGFDHASSIVAMTALGEHCNIAFFNPVTDIEHTGGVPTFAEISAGLKSAITVAHSLDIGNIPQTQELDDIVSDIRQKAQTCVVEYGLFDQTKLDFDKLRKGCNRCGAFCPLIKND
ncbi:MAG: phosphomethylpyrimidine synthase ThiC [Clostridiales bacterium]|jgi:phosphomethylpyrimidine synthase|nr:phosphomethylpyrimidine synthase ThiC [Clostridiales bacterium]